MATDSGDDNDTDFTDDEELMNVRINIHRAQNSDLITEQSPNKFTVISNGGN